MTKKEYIISLLSTLEGVRPLSSGLRLVVEKADISEETIDGLIQMISSALREVIPSDSQKVLSQSLTMLQGLRHQEDIIHKSELIELKKLEDMMSDI